METEKQMMSSHDWAGKSNSKTTAEAPAQGLWVAGPQRKVDEGLRGSKTFIFLDWKVTWLGVHPDVTWSRGPCTENRVLEDND